MSTIIISATEFEIKPSLKFFKQQDIKVFISGVGAGASIYHITKAILSAKPDFIVQAGVGGSFDPALKPGDVVAISEDEFGDLGVMENKQWHNLFDLGFLKANQRPFKQGVLKNQHKDILGQTGLELAKATTVNEVTTSRSRINLYKQRGIEVESMEGAALHYVALMEKIPFLQIRSISNFVGVRDKSKWDLKAAIQNLNDVLMNGKFWR